MNKCGVLSGSIEVVTVASLIDCASDGFTVPWILGGFVFAVLPILIFLWACRGIVGVAFRVLTAGASSMK